MNLFDRFVRVVTSNVNSVVKAFEDPEKVLDQAVNDMQNDLVKIRQSYAEISATEKRMIKQKEAAETNAAEWYRRAQLALEVGSSRRRMGRYIDRCSCIYVCISPSHGAWA